MTNLSTIKKEIYDECCANQLDKKSGCKTSTKEKQDLLMKISNKLGLSLAVYFK